MWQRHVLLSKHDRLLRLEKTHREQTIELNDEQIRLLARFSPEFREQQIEVHYTGELVAVDTFFVGAHKGVGKMYLQTVLDCYSCHAWGLRYTSKLPSPRSMCTTKRCCLFSKPTKQGSIPSCRTMGVSSVEQFLQLEGIVSTVQRRCAGRRAFIERLHRTLLDEHFRIKGRVTWY